MMKSVSVWKQELAGGAHTERLASLYCCAPEQTPTQAARYAAVLDGLEKLPASLPEAAALADASAFIRQHLPEAVISAYCRP